MSEGTEFKRTFYKLPLKHLPFSATVLIQFCILFVYATLSSYIVSYFASYFFKLPVERLLKLSPQDTFSKYMCVALVTKHFHNVI